MSGRTVWRWCAAVWAAGALATPAAGLPAGPAAWAPPPANAGFDYQIGGDAPLRPGVTVVARDWFAGAAPGGAYGICYVNAFQTQDDEPGVDRPDERSRWPADLVLRQLGDDPEWGGEYPVDISSPARRARAARWVEPMIQTCADKGFRAVELDNLDSWTRFDGTPVADRVPFGRAEAVAYARLLVRQVHARGLAAGQKNAPELGRTARNVIGFDFAIAEECGRYHECRAYRAIHGDRLIAIEYRAVDFRRACGSVGARVSVILRDRGVTAPGNRGYRYAAC